MKNDYSIRFSSSFYSSYSFTFSSMCFIGGWRKRREKFFCSWKIDEEDDILPCKNSFLSNSNSSWKTEVFFQKNIIHFYWKNISYPFFFAKYNCKRKNSGKTSHFFRHSTSKHLSSVFIFLADIHCWNVHSIDIIYRLMIIQLFMIINFTVKYI